MQPKAREKEEGSRMRGRGRETAGDQLIFIVKALFHQVNTYSP